MKLRLTFFIQEKKASCQPNWLLTFESRNNIGGHMICWRNPIAHCTNSHDSDCTFCRSYLIHSCCYSNRKTYFSLIVKLTKQPGIDGSEVETSSFSCGKLTSLSFSPGLFWAKNDLIDVCLPDLSTSLRLTELL